MVSKRIRILVVAFVLGLLGWQAFGHVRGSLDQRRLASLELQLAAADAEVAAAGTQTAVFAFG